MLGEEDLGVTSVWAVGETFAARVPTLHLCAHYHAGGGYRKEQVQCQNYASTSGDVSHD